MSSRPPIPASEARSGAEAPLALRSALLEAAGFRHAFFGRRGGVSRDPWATLNFAAASTGDDPVAVEENVRRAAAVLGVARERLYFLSQVHGVAHQVLEGTEDPGEVARVAGDITVSRAAGVACGVRAADCVPVLVADRRSGVVAAIHSGWRGTAAGAARAGVSALRRIAGNRGELVAAIGPHIERCCFEVGADVARALAAASPAGERAIAWADSSARADRAAAKVDLRRVVRAQLEDAGVAPEAIEDVLGCTFCDPARFHSYRRDGVRSGRMLSAIVVRE